MAEIISINCKEKTKILDELYDDISKIREKLSVHNSLTDLDKYILENLSEIIDEKEKEISDIENELIGFLKDKLLKYWKLTIKENKRGWIEEYLIFPYSYLEENNCFFAVISNDIHNNGSVAELKDIGIFHEWFFRGDVTITMEEITLDEFLKTFRDHAFKIIDSRLVKLANRGGGILLN